MSEGGILARTDAEESFIGPSVGLAMQLYHS